MEMFSIHFYIPPPIPIILTLWHFLPPKKPNPHRIVCTLTHGDREIARDWHNLLGRRNPMNYEVN